MAAYDCDMAISVTEFKRHCLEIIRRVERTGESVAITRRGRVVAQLCRPGAQHADAAAKPWERLRAAGGRLLAAPGVRRAKAALSSGCKAHPATAPAGSNRSSHGGNEMAEAFG
jgi:antitoxin (DNA-binding transcriptional repressor) of toxin-antitoxin stability system